MKDYGTKVDNVTPEPASEFNNIQGELKKPVESFDQPFQGGSEQQLSEAMSNYSSAGDFYQDNGVADAYSLIPIANRVPVTGYYDGLRIRFIAANTNTTTSTINVNSLGIKAIKKNNGSSNLEANDINLGDHVELNYVQSGDYFLLTINRTHQQLMSGSIDGLKCEPIAPDADHDIKVNKGICVDSTGSVLMQLDSDGLIKHEDEAWAEGDGNGGLPNGVILSPNTTYHKFLIRKISGQLDGGIDTSITAANLLATPGAEDYKWYRRIASIKTDGSSNIRDFTQIGDYFLWNTPILDIDVSVTSTTAQIGTINTPLGIKTIAIANILIGINVGNNVIAYVSSLDSADLLPSEAAAPLGTQESNGATKSAWAKIFVPTNTLSQIRYRYNFQPADFLLSTLGWIDFRGKNNLG